MLETLSFKKRENHLELRSIPERLRILVETANAARITGRIDLDAVIQRNNASKLKS